jgi:hypothetical protein
MAACHGGSVQQGGVKQDERRRGPPLTRDVTMSGHRQEDVAGLCWILDLTIIQPGR